jgi:hypothetical protein
MDPKVVAKALSSIGKNVGPAVLEKAKELGVEIPPQLDDPSAEPTPEVLAELIRDIGFHFFPLLKPGTDTSY